MPMSAATNSTLWMRRFARVVARTYLLKRPEAVELAAAAFTLFGAAASPERSAVELLEPAEPQAIEAAVPSERASQGPL